MIVLLAISRSTL